MRRHAGTTLALLVLALTAGCLGIVVGTEQPTPVTEADRQGTTPPGGGLPAPTAARLSTFSTVQAVCEPVEPGFGVAMYHDGSGNATLTVTGTLDVTEAGAIAPPAALGEPEPRHYALYVSTEPLPGREPTPCPEGGHVAYEATIELPHDGTEPFELTVYHDGEVAGGVRLSVDATSAGVAAT